MFGQREPAWRRNQENRARQEREQHEARRRQRLGLAPTPRPERHVSGDSFRDSFYFTSQDTTTSFTQTAASSFNSYRTMMDWGASYRHAVQNSATIEAAPRSGVAIAVPPQTPEREPSLREIWAD